jgi:hypothetical protein
MGVRTKKANSDLSGRGRLHDNRDFVVVAFMGLRSASARRTKAR